MDNDSKMTDICKICINVVKAHDKGIIIALHTHIIYSNKISYASFSEMSTDIKVTAQSMFKDKLFENRCFLIGKRTIKLSMK
jgi:hypothetical protein